MKYFSKQDYDLALAQFAVTFRDNSKDCVVEISTEVSRLLQKFTQDNFRAVLKPSFIEQTMEKYDINPRYYNKILNLVREDFPDFDIQPEGFSLWVDVMYIDLKK